jgi:hypothetical protein
VGQVKEGSHTIKVVPYDVQFGPQPFALAWRLPPHMGRQFPQSCILSSSNDYVFMYLILKGSPNSGNWHVKAQI